MTSLDEYIYRAEQLVIWEQQATIEQIRSAFDVTATKATNSPLSSMARSKPS